MIISNELWHKKLVGHTAAGTDASAVASSAIDVTAANCYDRARLIIELGTVTSGGKLSASVQTCDTSDGTYVEEGGIEEEVLTGKSEGTIIIDVPVTRRYVKVSYQRATANIELDVVELELYDGFAKPVPQDSGVAKMVYVG